MSPEVRKLILDRYFQLYAEEKVGETPAITEELDKIEKVLGEGSELSSTEP